MVLIAQLVKLRDYISRYDWNPYRYSSQFIRLKQDNWDKLIRLWEQESPYGEENIESTDNKSSFLKLKSMLSKGKSVKQENAMPMKLPDTEIELRQYFLDKLFPIQLKWATSTVTDVSFTDKNYEHDQTLKYFLQRFSDIYLLLYYPIFNIKQAPVDGEIILISPVGIEVIYMLEEAGTTILAGESRTWTVERQNDKTTMISPVIALKRTEHVVKSILNKHEIDVPIYKTVLSRTSNIVFSNEPYMTNIIGKFQYDEWFLSKRRLNSTLKSWQLKAVEVLLKYCLTTSVKRPEWDEDEIDFPEQ